MVILTGIQRHHTVKSDPISNIPPHSAQRCEIGMIGFKLPLVSIVISKY